MFAPQHFDTANEGGAGAVAPGFYQALKKGVLCSPGFSTMVMFHDMAMKKYDDDS